MGCVWETGARSGVGMNRHFGGDRAIRGCKACGNDNPRMVRLVKAGGKCRVFCVNCGTTTHETASEKTAVEDWNAGRVCMKVK